MARSIDPVVHAVRGFVPARTDEERFLMRHIEDLARTAQSRGIARYSGFLSDREQELARAALGRAGLEEGFRFDGGWPEAERRILCLEPEYSYPENPICCVQLQCRAQAGAVLPAHKDYLGSLMGLEIRREALGDIVLPPDAPGTAYVFALEPAARLICQELLQAGRTELATRLLAPDEVPESGRQSAGNAPQRCRRCGWTPCWPPCCVAAVGRPVSWSPQAGWRSTICRRKSRRPRCTRAMCSRCAARGALL